MSTFEYEFDDEIIEYLDQMLKPSDQNLDNSPTK
jgi:hypothetical protein